MIIKKPFFFVRHGVTDWNLHGRVMGHHDIPLNDLGRNQARSLQTLMNTIHCSHIFYSPLQRAQETMEIISHNLEIPQISKIELREQHFGDWEGVLGSSIRDVAYKVNPPNGETYEDFCNRVVKGINEILSISDLPLLVAHSGIFWVLSHYIPVEIDSHNCQLIKFEPCEDSLNGWNVYVYM
jgi:uncharacterized phosphatase